jgi:hypothetical protein
MELAEIDAKIAELEALKAKALAAEKEKEDQARYDEAVVLFPELIAIVRRLHEIGYLPPRLAKVLTDETGKVNPGMYLKRPRAVIRQHDAASEDEQPTLEPHAAPRKRAARSQASA